MSDEFYEIEVWSIDWSYVLARMIKKYSPSKDGENVQVIICPHDDHATYKLRKDQIPAAGLAVALGATIEQVVNATDKIVLRSFKQTKYWQTPTVDYYGEC